jgi:hypothetical protein
MCCRRCRKTLPMITACSNWILIYWPTSCCSFYLAIGWPLPEGERIRWDQSGKSAFRLNAFDKYNYNKHKYCTGPAEPAGFSGSSSASPFRNTYMLSIETFLLIGVSYIALPVLEDTVCRIIHCKCTGHTPKQPLPGGIFAGKQLYYPISYNRSRRSQAAQNTEHMRCFFTPSASSADIRNLLGSLKR